MRARTAERVVRRTLTALLTIALFVALVPAAANAYAGTPAQAESDFLNRLNATRASSGLAPLALNPALSDYARAWSAHMAGAGGISHDPNLAAETAAVIPDWQRAGENVGSGGDVASLHQAFYDSAPHRANMLGAYNQVGIGVVVTNGTIYVTFRFAQGSLPQPRDTTPPTGVINPPLPATENAASFTVGWWGSDTESGVAYFNVDVSDNGGPWVRWFDNSAPKYVVGSAASGEFTFFGIPGHTYAFRVGTVDKAGNASTSAPSTTTVSASAAPAAPFSAGYAVARTGDVSALQSVPINGSMWRADMVRGFAVRPGGGGYLLDLYGALHALGNAPTIAGSAYWPGWDIARGIALNPDGKGGYVLDGFGGLSPFGTATPVSGSYWPGWDIARDIILLPTSTATRPAGYVMDEWGGLHPFGAAPRITDGPYWPGWQIAKDAIANPAGTGGWILDGWGGMHPFGGAPNLALSGYWTGWDIARGAAMWNSPTGVKGYSIDGWGGLHPINNAPNLTATRYWAGQDIAKYIDIAP
jgi:uncharacterized protein YkwD